MREVVAMAIPGLLDGSPDPEGCDEPLATVKRSAGKYTPATLAV